jgi:hypothetical protein
MLFELARQQAGTRVVMLTDVDYTNVEVKEKLLFSQRNKRKVVTVNYTVDGNGINSINSCRRRCRLDW